jgi:hypothetical protein
VSVALSWTASSGATGYDVARSTVSGGPYTTIATNSATNSFTDPITLTATEYYVVSAVNAIGESPFSAQGAAVYLVPSFSLSTGAATERMNSGTTISIPFVVSSLRSRVRRRKPRRCCWRSPIHEDRFPPDGAVALVYLAVPISGGRESRPQIKQGWLAVSGWPSRTLLPSHRGKGSR